MSTNRYIQYTCTCTRSLSISILFFIYFFPFISLHFIPLPHFKHATAHWFHLSMNMQYLNQIKSLWFALALGLSLSLVLVLVFSCQNISFGRHDRCLLCVTRLLHCVRPYVCTINCKNTLKWKLQKYTRILFIIKLEHGIVNQI